MILSRTSWISGAEFGERPLEYRRGRMPPTLAASLRRCGSAVSGHDCRSRERHQLHHRQAFAASAVRMADQPLGIAGGGGPRRFQQGPDHLTESAAWWRAAARSPPKPPQSPTTMFAPGLRLMAPRSFPSISMVWMPWLCSRCRSGSPNLSGFGTMTSGRTISRSSFASRHCRPSVVLWQIPVGRINGSRAMNPYDAAVGFSDLTNTISSMKTPRQIPSWDTFACAGNRYAYFSAIWVVTRWFHWRRTPSPGQPHAGCGSQRGDRVLFERGRATQRRRRAPSDGFCGLRKSSSTSNSPCL